MNGNSDYNTFSVFIIITFNLFLIILFLAQFPGKVMWAIFSRVFIACIEKMKAMFQPWILGSKFQDVNYRKSSADTDLLTGFWDYISGHSSLALPFASILFAILAVLTNLAVNIPAV